MRSLRATLRAAVLLAWTALVYAAWLLTRPVGWLSADVGAGSHRFLVRTWARAAATMLGLSVRSTGTPPTPPFFLVSNHLSYLDVVVLFTRVEGVFLAKAEISRWPVAGMLAHTTGTLFVDRARRSDLVRVNAELERALACGRGVMVFPEGTSTRGERVEPFKPPVFEVPHRRGMPVRCAALAYALPPGSPPAEDAVAWWGQTPIGPHCWRLLGLRSIDAELCFAEGEVHGEDRKSLADAARRAVEACYDVARRSLVVGPRGGR